MHLSGGFSGSWSGSAYAVVLYGVLPLDDVNLFFGGQVSTSNSQTGTDPSIKGTFTVDVGFTYGLPTPAKFLVAACMDGSGTGTNTLTLQMTYNPILAQLLFGAESGMRLGRLDETLGIWFNSVSGNIGGIPHFIGRAYNPATDFYLGNFGVDIVNHVVWAVVNHNSEFGVGVLSVGERFVTVTRPANNIIHLRCLGQASALNRIESSPTLSPNSFTTLASVMADDTGAFQFDDTISSTNRFYRLAYP